ncbi:zinc-finger protein [Boothiomyces sp. JEL0838]|nr:zinc-finger protein [Boothiomyces sp. JEL0838]
MVANHLKPVSVQNGELETPALPCKWNSCENTTYESIDELVQHVSKNHLHFTSEDLELPNLCFWINCGNKFRNFEDLTTHLASTHVGEGKRQYICQWYKCDRNGKPFAHRQKIMRHLQTHTGDKPYQCTTCNQKFSEMVVMEQHKRRHTNEKPFKCPELTCQKQFAIAGALATHTRTHTGEKPFSCETDGCQKRFADSSNLSKHKRVHTKEKPFKCPVEPCEKTFARTDQVTRHAKIHRGVGGKQPVEL